MTSGLTTPDGIILGYASRSTRLFGQFLDGLVSGVPVGVAALISSFSSALGAAALMASIAWAIFYYFFADGLHGGQSYGKRWLGIKVVNANTGAPCTFGQSLIRNFLLAVLGPLDWVFIFGEHHQRLGDKAAGTIVIDAD